ncbi:MAG TPA: response regulator transcription factor [Vulgatibacter sp.]
MQKILIVEDDPDLQEVLEFNLRREGFETARSSRGAEALRMARSLPPDLVLLDLMLPDLSGTDVCRQLKDDPATAHVPVVIVTARGEEANRIVGLELGADDFVAKPFSLRELTLRIRAILRRAATPGPGGESTLTAGPFALDRGGHRLLVGGRDVSATTLELGILAQLMEGRGRVISREQLLAAVWPDDDGVSERAIDTHVKRLREKLGGAANAIETVRGVGYRFRDVGG